MERGFTYGDAYEWKFLAVGTLRRELALDLPCEYRDAGFHAREGRSWFWLRMFAREAAEYANHGWTPAAVRRLRRVIHLVDAGADVGWAGGPGDRRPVEAQWVRTRISPHYTCLYILAGQTPASSLELEGRRNAGDPFVEAAMTTLAALRRPTP